MAPPVALTVAGSDSGGGAGIQADLKAMAAAGVHGTSAVTALTAQNSQGVQDIQGMEPEFVARQIKSVTDDMAVRATKTGMLFSGPIIETVVEHRNRLGNLVVDPVMVAASGDRLMQESAEARLVQDLLPLADVITPNLHEAKIIAEHLGVTSLSDPEPLARNLALELGEPGVLVKGGHTSTDRAVDYFVRPDGEEFTLDAPRLDTDNTHGSGCAFSSLIAAHLARVEPLRIALQQAKDQLTEAMKTSYRPGDGPGTLNFLQNQNQVDLPGAGSGSQVALDLES